MSSEAQKSDTELNKDENKNAHASNKPQPTRLRSRFPKATPNLGAIERKTQQPAPQTQPEAKLDVDGDKDAESINEPSSKTHQELELKQKEVDSLQASLKEPGIITTTSNTTSNTIEVIVEEEQHSPFKKLMPISAQSPNSNNSINNVVRIRSRFPKPQPNLAQSSSIERFRRISGHFSSQTSVENASNATVSILDHKNSTQSSHFEPHSPYKQILSPKIVVGLSDSPLKQASQGSTTFRQLLSGSSSHSIGTNASVNTMHVQSPAANNLTNSTHFSQPATPYTPVHSVYSTRFPKEQIKNVIKYIAMQKLKKIESDALKEKRREYKKKLSKLNIELNSHNNENSSDSSLSNRGDSLTATNATIDKSKLRMRDFLYYTPKQKKSDEFVLERIDDLVENQQQQQEASPNHQVSLTSVHDNEASNMSSETNDSIASRPNVEQETTAAATPRPSESNFSIAATHQTRNYAPQLKFSEDGQIIINEESLFIQRENIEPIYDDTVVENEQGDNLTYTSYRKHHHTKKWTERETAKFYKALSMIGTDFTMIQRLFPNRSRDEIKRKFKREEKLNQALIDRILSKTDQIELSVFVSGSEDEETASTRSGSTSSKKGVQSVKRKNSLANRDIENKTSDKKQKLKRIRKREFIETDSENGSINLNQNTNSDKTQNSALDKNQTSTFEPRKSKSFITDSEIDTNSSSSLTHSVMANNSTTPIENNQVESINLCQVSKLAQAKLPETEEKSTSQTGIDNIPPLSQIIGSIDSVNLPRTDQMAYKELKNAGLESSESENENEGEEEEEEEEELVIDLDANSFKVAKNCTNELVNEAAIKLDNKRDRSDDEDNDEQIILDLDNNTFIKNGVNQSNKIEPSPTLSKSSIQITTTLTKNDQT